MKEDAGTVQVVVESDAPVDKMSISDWIVVVGVVAFIIAFLGHGIIF